MIEYFLLTALASVIFSYILLNSIKLESANEYVNNKGVWRFYIVSALIGWFIIPLLTTIVLWKLFFDK